MEENHIFFADAESSFEDSIFVILGVPFDGTCSFRKGTSLAPKKIREESYNHETYLFEHDVDTAHIPFHDLGDVNCLNLTEMFEGVTHNIEKIIDSAKFPILIGGEHSLTPPAVSKFENVGCVILDAHLDFRDDYEGEKNNHACATRRIVDLVGIENVLTIGIRSMERREKEEADLQKLKYIDAPRLKDIGMNSVLGDLNWNEIYLSLDMDFLDPSFAPGVGNPEYFGFSPSDVKECITILAPKLVGFDICETCPPFDSGNTSSLAARIVREVIGKVWKVNLGKYKEKYQKILL
jgi:agmatinase